MSRRVMRREPPKKKKPYKLIGVGVGIVVALLLAIFMTSGSKLGLKVVDRDPEELRRLERDGLDRLMQNEIDRATAQGAGKLELEQIRSSYQSALGKVGKN